MLLFLDVDGVLNTGSVTHAHPAALKIDNWPHALDLALLHRLKSVQQQTEALFVLSSTWRDNDLGKRLLAIGFAAVGISCDLVAGATPLLCQPRIDEIKKWLADHAPACKRWVAVDDLNLLEDAPGLGAHIVHTSLADGLTSDAAKECVAKLTAVQAPSPSPPPPPSAASRAAVPRVLPLQRQESTAEERIEWAGRPGAAAAGARAACGWGSHAALAELGAAYARKRLCSEQLSKQMIADASDLSLAHRLVSTVLAQLTQRTQAGAASPSLRGPTATQQLLALLSAAVPAHVAQADDAEADSDDDAGRQAASQTTHDAATLTPEQKQQARSAQALPTAVKGLLALGADTNTRDADGNTPLYLAVHLQCLHTALEVTHLLLNRGADPRARCAAPPRPVCANAPPRVAPPAARGPRRPQRLDPDSPTAPRAPSAHLAGRRRGGSPLHHALHLDRAPLVHRLVRGGAVPRRSATLQRSAALLAPFAARHGFGDEALAHMRAAMLAAVAREDAAAVRGLLQHGLPPDGALLFALVRWRRPCSNPNPDPNPNPNPKP